MKIVVLCEGKTEQAITQGLRELLSKQSKGGPSPGLKMVPVVGHLKRDKLRRLVELHVAQADVSGVVSLTDVYPKYKSAAEAIGSLDELIGTDHGGKFKAHAAQFEVEAWLIPHWKDIARWLGVQRKAPPGKPEDVNSENPPSKHIKALYHAATERRLSYDKVSSAQKWLTADRLHHSASECPNLREFLNSLLHFAGLEPLP